MTSTFDMYHPYPFCWGEAEKGYEAIQDYQRQWFMFDEDEWMLSWVQLELPFDGVGVVT